MQGTVAIAGCAVGGGALGASLVGGAATAAPASTTAAQVTDSDSGTSTDSGTGTPAPTRPGHRDPSMGGHMANGVTETLLTGETADKVRAAAQAALPGGTIQRVENDAEGSPYEARATKADGTRVTVKLDDNFAVLTIEEGR